MNLNIVNSVHTIAVKCSKHIRRTSYAFILNLSVWDFHYQHLQTLRLVLNKWYRLNHYSIHVHAFTQNTIVHYQSFFLLLLQIDTNLIICRLTLHEVYIPYIRTLICYRKICLKFYFIWITSICTVHISLHLQCIWKYKQLKFDSHWFKKRNNRCRHWVEKTNTQKILMLYREIKSTCISYTTITLRFKHIKTYSLTCSCHTPKCWMIN